MPKVRSQEHLALGQAIRELRQGRGWSLEIAAERWSISASHLGYIERGQTDATLAMLFKIANGLGAELHDILKLAESIEARMGRLRNLPPGVGPPPR